MSIVNVIEQLLNESSRNGKEEILKKNDSKLLRDVLLYAYDPFKRFNLSSKIDSFVGVGKNSFEDSFVNIFTLLDDLCSRAVSGNKAVNLVSAFTEMLDESSFALLKNIIKKDLRCGISDSTINRVFKDLVPTFDVQLAAAPDRIGKMEYPAYVSPKLDGMRCVVVYDGETVQYLSRGGKPITTLEHCSDEVVLLLNNVPGVLDCEAMSSDFNDTMSSVKRKTAKNTDSKLFVFDYIPFEDFSNGVGSLTQKARLYQLLKMFESVNLKSIEMVEHVVVNDEESAFDCYAKYRQQGLEGAIVKNINAPYKFKRNDAWIKIKPKETIDLEIVGYEEGTGKYEGMLGALIIHLSSGVTTRVGTGFSDDQRKEFWEIRNQLISQIAEVEYMEKTKNKDGTSRLRHTRFIRLRSICGSKA